MLLEREKELDLLSGLIDGLSTSGGKVVLVRGEAGIGKSSLVTAFLESIMDSAHVHVGFCDDLETPQPFGPLWDIARHETDLHRALRSSDRQEILQAFFDLLMSSLRPGVVLLEDTHWSDEATLDAIKYAGRRIRRSNGLLLLTYRDEEVDLDNPLRAVLGALPSRDVARIELGGLSRDAIAEIVAESGRDPDEVFEATRGNPFLVTEMALTGGDTVPESVRDSVMARVGRLSIMARQMLRHMSAIPERSTTGELEALIGSAESQLAECERLGLLDVDGHTVAFRHDLIRRAIEASLTASEAMEIHRTLLDVLPADTDPARLVHHARGAGDVDRLIELAPRAAMAAAEVGGHREASAHYRSIESYLDRLPGARQSQLLVDWARMEFYLAHEESVEILDRAIQLNRDRNDRHDLAQALTLAITVHETHGHALAAREHADEAIELLESDGPRSDLALALSRCAYLLLHLGEGLLADSVIEEALAVAEESGNDLARLRALSVKGLLAYVRGEPGGLDLVAHVHREAERYNYRFEEVKVLRGVAYIAQEINDLAKQEDFARRARDTAIRYELPILEAEANTVYADALMRKGDWSSAEDLATETLGSHANADLHLKRVLGLLRMRTGRSGARQYLDGAWSLAQRITEIDFLLHVGACLAEQMWLRGSTDPVLVDRLKELVHRGLRQEFPWPAGWLAFWLWRLGEIADVPDGTPEPHAQSIRGEVAEAAESWRAMGMPYRQAVALSCGETSQRLQALEIVETLGADAVAAKLRKDLRDEGAVVPRGKGRVTRAHVAGLTARQDEVLRLLAEDLSNPQIADRLFLSPRTVENHVSAVLAKLDCSTRAEAVRKARSEGLI